MLYAAAQLRLDVVEYRSGRANRRHHFRATKSIEGLHLEMLLQRVLGLINEEGVGIVTLGVRNQIKGIRLLF